MRVPFNRPYVNGREMSYIAQVVRQGQFAGNGNFTKRCQDRLAQLHRIERTFLTTSGTDALEMAALLLDIHEGDEVIVPAFTFVSSALAFARQGATIIFADSRPEQPNMDEALLEDLISPRTKAIVPVHYAGVACEMDTILAVARARGIRVVEDAAQAIGASYKSIPLGSLGDLSCFSFHETKNIQCGEGGLLGVNDGRLVRRAEMVWEKGTNRQAFFRGEVDKYRWVETGSSFLPSDILAAFLWAQLEGLEEVLSSRTSAWQAYYQALKPLEDAGKLRLPTIPPYASNNGHIFYCLTENISERDSLLEHLRSSGVQAVFHYLALNESPYYKAKSTGRLRVLPNAKRYEETLVRLPLFCGIRSDEIGYVVDSIFSYFQKARSCSSTSSRMMLSS